MRGPTGRIYILDGVEIDTGVVVLRRGGEERALRPKTFRLLVYLIENRGRLVPKEELIRNLWPDTAVSDGALAQCVADIRRELAEDPRQPRFIRTAPRLGYQFIGNVEEQPSPAVVLEEITETRVEYSEEIVDEELPVPGVEPLRITAPLRASLSRRVGLIILLAAVAVAAGLTASSAWRRAPAALDPGVRTAVFQFENRSGAKDMDWLRAGLSDMVATSLSASPGISLITPDQLPGGSRAAAADPARRLEAMRAARRAGARAAVFGAFSTLGGSIRVDTQIYNVVNGRLIGGEALTVDKPGLLLMQVDSLATRLAARLGSPVPSTVRVAEVMTNNLEAYRIYSLALARTRDVRLPEAIELYQQALRLDPDFAMAYARIGYAYAASWGNTVKGKPFLEKAYQLSDRLTPRDRLFIRAWYAIACRDYKGAEQAYHELLSAFPTETEAYMSLATLLLTERRGDEARESLERAMVHDPEMPQLHNLMTTTWLELRRPEQATESARRYVSLSSGEPNGYDTLGLAYQATGSYRQALDAYMEALRRKPDFDIAMIHLGNLYFQLGRYRSALDQYREVIRVASSDVERGRGHSSCSWVYWKKGDLDRAQEEAARIPATLDPARVLISAARGRVKLTDDLRQQILAPSSSARGGPENRRMRYFIAGYAALRERKADQALEDFRSVLREPSSYWAIDPLDTCVADALLELGRTDEAIAEYRKVLSFNPNYPLARYRLGLALERKGLRAAARSEFEHFLAVWSSADEDIPELVDARRRVGDRAPQSSEAVRASAREMRSSRHS